MRRRSTADNPLLQIKKIGLFCRDEHAEEVAHRIERVLTKGELETRLLARNEDEGGSPPKDKTVGTGVWRPDVLIALGGDGTVLRALSSWPTVPVLPINFGTVGFLTAGDEKDLSQMIFRMLEGDYFIEDRMILESEIKGSRWDVINEVALKGTVKMVTVDVAVDGQHIHRVRGDGVLVGTPTGSTSYLMSTGASIVEPTVDAIILSGVNEFRLPSRSLILDSKSVITLKLDEETREEETFVTHDGRDRIPLTKGMEVTVRKSDKMAHLIFFDEQAFFRNLKERLGW